VHRFAFDKAAAVVVGLTTTHYKGCKGKFNLPNMSANKIVAAEEGALSYEAQMSVLRGKLAGRPYCNDVKNMLPELTKAQIHGAVNGRNENPLVLAAIKIVVHRLDEAEKRTQERLNQLSEQLSELGVPA
jgi:hypothetical protein